MKDSYLSTLLQMRSLVGFLGERPQFAWWDDFVLWRLQPAVT
jgi:hypothetical protein